MDFCNAGQGMTLVITDADDAVQYHQGSQTLRGFFGSPKMSKGLQRKSAEDVMLKRPLEILEDLGSRMFEII